MAKSIFLINPSNNSYTRYDLGIAAYTKLRHQKKKSPICSSSQESPLIEQNISSPETNIFGIDITDDLFETDISIVQQHPDPNLKENQFNFSDEEEQLFFFYDEEEGVPVF